MSTSPDPRPTAAPVSADQPVSADEPGRATAAGAVVAPAPQRPHAFLLYNLARLAILLVALGVFYLLGLRGAGLIILAVLSSGAVSVIVLFRLRTAAAVNLGSTWRRLSQRIDKGAASEDDD